MAKLELLSRTIYDADGVQTVWDFNFAGGYILPEHVKAYYELGDVRTPVDVTPIMLIGANQLRISPAVPTGAVLTIYRDTPKNAPLVDFVDRGTVSEVALDTIAKQAVFVAAEAGDSAATGSTDVAVAAASLAQAQSLAAAVSATAAASSATVAATSAANATATAAVEVAAHKAELSGGGGAGDVGYTPKGGGAVTTSVEAVLQRTINAKDKGAGSTKTTAQNKTALQLAITEAGITGGVVYVDYDCDYGFKLRTPSTWPSFTGITKPVLVIDYSRGDTQLPNAWPTAYDGMQARHWFHTPQTTSPGQHDGNYQWARSDWNPGFVASNDSDLTGARTSFDSRRCGFALAVNGSIGWQLLQGSRTGATLTDEELSNLTITKFAIAGDTLGDYTPYLVERKTGFTSYGGGRNLPSAYHHFEPVLEGTAADIALFESSSTTTGVRLRNVNGATSGGSAGAQDVLVKNVAGSVVLSTEEGDGLRVDRTSRRVTLTKALQQAKVNLSYSPSITPNADAGNIQQVFCNNGTAFTINTPSGTAVAGQKLTIRVSNISGGSLGTLNWGAGYKLATWVQPASGFSRSITFFYDDSTPAWVEINRTGSDVPN